ncbi:MAG: hypothetical protein FJY85_08210, partial [Deltaproteobacteria bacterium]|nr:hypothetical protein [Deltaproteobacteria bacterium]
TGVLYLENNLTAAAFTPDRLEILRLLSSQAAISIENARLYERQEDYSRTLEQKVNERTAALDEAKRLAERANRIKSEFLTNMSHELRTPLNAVIGFSEILEDQAFGTLNDKQMRYVSHILNSGRHLLQLINDILDLSKVESGKMELHPSRVNLEHLLASSLVMIKEKAMKHRLKLDLKLSDELVGMELEADEIKLKQIMFNLLSNATKFTPDGGAIGVEATRDGHEVVVKVWDTGIGVKPQDRDRIFGPFEQVDSSYARRQEGTGLGLALSKRLVELHGGRIWVESQGAGSTFVFTVPTKWSPLLDGRDT